MNSPTDLGLFHFVNVRKQCIIRTWFFSVTN